MKCYVKNDDVPENILYVNNNLNAFDKKCRFVFEYLCLDYLITI